MRLDVITATSIAKGINKARFTGNFSLLAVVKLNMFQHYLAFTKDDVKSFLKLQDKINKMLNHNPLELCNIREASCTPGSYISVGSGGINNPYNPPGPVVIPEPEPEPENLPANIGDNTITVLPNVTTVLTLAMFTSDTTAPYYDPEGDLIDAIRIDRLHSTNVGVFYLSGVAVTNGTIITREQLIDGQFTHTGVDTQTILSDGFEFSGRDEGSGIWVN